MTGFCRKSPLFILVFFIIPILFLTTGCGEGGGGGGSDDSAKAEEITISGKITFDSVPATVSGLDYSSTTKKPVRGVLVEAIKASDSSILDSTVTDTQGNYSLSVPENTEVIIRIKAQMIQNGSPSWDFRVVDNTNAKALYVMESSVFNSGTTDISNKNLNASSGWGGTSYTSARVAAPFAILDFIYQALQVILSVDADVNLPQLLINWSPDNIPSPGIKSSGYIGTTHYSFSEKEIYILGAEDNDTDEYDGHVIVHEFGHYLVHRLGRTDTLGGQHSLTDRLDARVAFDEGFDNALSAIVLGNPDYVDTYGIRQSQGLHMDIEDNDFFGTARGWYSEESIQSIIYDLYDTSNESGVDGLSLGFAPLYNVVIKDLKTTSSFTTIFSFIDHLKSRYKGQASVINAINQLLQYEDITDEAADEWDSTERETNDGGNPYSLPVYTELNINVPETICISDEFGTYNKLLDNKYFYFEIIFTGNYKFDVIPQSVNDDPRIRVYLNGSLIKEINSGADGEPESVTMHLTPGTYAGVVTDYKIENNMDHHSTHCYDIFFN
ncbi:MAG: hypothetical protein GXO97_09785 [Nitrospirae bacterium]|nr:hypothetical protein [Nitrospirota bacterium]